MLRDGILVWRSDTRKTNEIFGDNDNKGEGFKSRIAINKEKWWQESINKAGRETCSDANQNKCVSVSFNMFSAPIFPMSKEETSYLYAIVLPAALKIDPSRELRENQNHTVIPSNLTEVVIDLHDYQVQEAQYILSQYNEEYFNSKQNVLLAGACLYAYEGMTYEIDAKNIVCAVEFSRNVSPEKIEGSFSITLQTSTFKFNGRIIENPHFEPKQYLAVSGNNTIVFDYSEKKEEALRMIISNSNKELKTPSIRHGLGGKVFRPGNSSTFFILAPFQSKYLYCSYCRN